MGKTRTDKISNRKDKLFKKIVYLKFNFIYLFQRTHSFIQKERNKDKDLNDKYQVNIYGNNLLELYKHSNLLAGPLRT